MNIVLLVREVVRGSFSLLRSSFFFSHKCYKALWRLPLTHVTLHELRLGFLWFTGVSLGQHFEMRMRGFHSVSKRNALHGNLIMPQCILAHFRHPLVNRQPTTVVTMNHHTQTHAQDPAVAA